MRFSISGCKRNQTNVFFFMFLIYLDGKRNKTNACFGYPDVERIKTIFVLLYSDGERNNTNVFLHIRMANAMKPMFCFAYPNVKCNKTKAFLDLSG